MQEKALKNTIEALSEEMEFKKKNCSKLEYRIQDINESLNTKERTISELEILIQEFQTEKDMHHKLKQEAFSLTREVTYQR